MSRADRLDLTPRCEAMRPRRVRRFRNHTPTPHTRTRRMDRRP